MKKAAVYFTRIDDRWMGKRMEHLIGEKLLEEAIRTSFGLELSTEPRGKGRYGKPFFSLRPELHYNISHSGRYIYCILAPSEVGIDIQEHRGVKIGSVLRRMVPESLREEILASEDAERLFFKQWVLREAYSKMTGTGLSADFRTLPLENGWHYLFSPEEGYSGAVFCDQPLELTWQEIPDILL